MFRSVYLCVRKGNPTEAKECLVAITRVLELSTAVHNHFWDLCPFKRTLTLRSPIPPSNHAIVPSCPLCCCAVLRPLRDGKQDSVAAGRPPPPSMDHFTAPLRRTSRRLTKTPPKRSPQASAGFGIDLLHAGAWQKTCRGLRGVCQFGRARAGALFSCLTLNYCTTLLITLLRLLCGVYSCCGYCTKDYSNINIILRVVVLFLIPVPGSRVADV